MKTNGDAIHNGPSLPVLATKELIVFPNNSVPLTVTSKRNVQTIEYALEHDSWILVVPLQEGKHPKEAGIDDLHKFGSLCKVEQARGNQERGYQIIVNGIKRYEIADIYEENDIYLAEAYEILPEMDIDSETLQNILSNGKTLAVEILKLSRGPGVRRLSDLVQGLDDPELFVHLCASHLELSFEDKLVLMREKSIKKRLVMTLDLLQNRKNSLTVQVEINRKLSDQMDKKQREVILREQLNAIREELGEVDEEGKRVDYMQRVKDSDMPEHARKVALEEAKRLETMPSVSPEAPNIKNYLDLMLDLPWKEEDAQDIDIRRAKELLDQEHYGLEKVKSRIVQHLAVMKLNRGLRGSILLLVGPPGVGKTSLGKSIAKAMNRKFVRASLGGVRDEADIRGHRRTYVGAMPGRLIQGIKRAGTKNPVFLLDEIDKLGRGWGGDPAGALLEVLDPEQNQNFEDHYLDVSYDLSQVVFIATANSMEGIPPALRDRMEIIQLSGYTTAEKFHIAKDHLWPTELEKHGLKPEQVKLRDDTLLRVITHYTREAGVRDLKRKMAAICRDTTEKVVLEGPESIVEINQADLERILGPEPFHLEVAETLLPPGVVTGLAWTPMGGDILFIESKGMRGKGKLTITGQLGDVMKESLHIAMSHVRSHLNVLNPRYDYENQDIHVHVPSGAIPKDGPSAGITMFVSLASLIANKEVPPSIAMSGEITLRGAVMPVGGIKEKVIAAHRAGIKKIILSEKNKKDLHEVPSEVKDQLEFVFVENIEEVLLETLNIDLKSPPPFYDERRQENGGIHAPA
ncbi:MAG: endopeptidase La [Oligoflexus sp.]